jgi:transposase
MRRIITNPMWETLEPLVQAAKKSLVGPKPDTPDREFLEAVLYRARTGTPWRDLPEGFGDWNAVYQRWKRWRKAGNFQRLFDSLPAGSALGEAKKLFVDSTVIRAHPHASGAEKRGQKGNRRLAGAGAATAPRST